MTKTKRAFASTRRLNELIALYFESKETEKAEPPTLTGLALFLGFDSRNDFEACEVKGVYSAPLKRATLRIEAAYEKKLHQTSSGAVFALKNLGWNDRGDNKPQEKETDSILQVEIVQSELKPVSSEKEVVL